MKTPSNLLFISLLVAGCLHVPKQRTPGNAPPAPSPDQMATILKENEALRRTLAAKDQEINELEHSIANLKIQILEFEAIVKNMRDRSSDQQNRLDTAIIDVVRAKAKLRSLESKAEAASTIAEAEIAVRAMKSRAKSPDDAERQEIATAEQLLEMSTKEFRAKNFGGALYLANQTKGLVRTTQMRLGDNARGTVLEGEASFVQPVHLKVLKRNSNLREGPGLDQKISGRLAKGTLLVGYSYKDRWIRVETQTGLTGWIFQTLVGAR